MLSRISCICVHKDKNLAIGATYISVRFFVMVVVSHRSIYKIVMLSIFFICRKMCLNETVWPLIEVRVMVLLLLGGYLCIYPYALSDSQPPTNQTENLLSQVYFPKAVAKFLQREKRYCHLSHSGKVRPPLTPDSCYTYTKLQRRRPSSSSSSSSLCLSVCLSVCHEFWTYSSPVSFLCPLLFPLLSILKDVSFYSYYNTFFFLRGKCMHTCLADSSRIPHSPPPCLYLCGSNTAFWLSY